MQFKATEAAFEGFRLIRREPRTIVIWAVFSLIAGVALTVAMIATGIGRFSQPTDGAAMTSEALMGFLLGEAVAVIGAVLIASIMGAAVYRAVLRPAEAPLTRLRLGGDEMRLVLLTVIMSVLFMLLLVALMIPIGILGVGLAVGSGVGQGSSPPNAGGVLSLVLVTIVGYLLALAALVFFAVRLSLAGVMTFAERRLRVFESWRLTKGRFWPLLGCYALAVVLMLPLYAVMMAVYFGTSFAFAGGDGAQVMADIARPDMSSLAAYFNPARTVYLVLAGALGGVMNAVMYAPAAAVYLQIADTLPENQAEVFA